MGWTLGCRRAQRPAPSAPRSPGCLTPRRPWPPQAFAFNYIAKHSKRAAEAEKGTGGSDFMPALQGFRDTTTQHLLP